MNTKDLSDAERLWGLLDTNGREEALKLAARVRTTGVEATLRWLEPKPSNLMTQLCVAAALPHTRVERQNRTNLELLTDSRRVLAIVEALHLIARAR
jgi:hypothetical protein